MIQFLDHLCSWSFCYPIFTCGSNVGQDSNSMNALVIQLTRIFGNRFCFIQDPVLFMVLPQDKVRKFCRHNPDESDLNRLVINWNFFDGIRFPIKWDFVGVLVNQVGNHNFLFGSFMRILIDDLVELTRCWGFPFHDSVEFSKTFVKLMVSKCSVFKVHFIEDFYSWFILKEGRIGWTSSDHVSSLHTNTGIWSSCIFCFKLFLRIIHVRR